MKNEENNTYNIVLCIPGIYLLVCRKHTKTTQNIELRRRRLPRSKRPYHALTPGDRAHHAPDYRTEHRDHTAAAKGSLLRCERRTAVAL
ncbi:hypothetical protein RR48_10512 [Papilio machaon]|uniref:Uncharacterized protein n=1 Tax=Papilio machaon TaxID=76193 RepID=A0A194R5C8_PAPMA|nr:hypothetical protein RR48_10512 [Papilio machaon]